jgi:hypothetical protein
MASVVIGNGVTSVTVDIAGPGVAPVATNFQLKLYKLKIAHF